MRIATVQVAAPVRVPAGQDGGSRRHAPPAQVGPVEPDPGLRQVVDVRRLDAGGSVTTGVSPPGVIGEDDDHVRRCGGLRSSR